MRPGANASLRALAVCPIILLRVILRFCCRNAVMREQVPGCGSVNRPGWLASFSVSVDETRPGADAIRTARAGLRQREQADLVRVHGHPPFLSMVCSQVRTQSGRQVPGCGSVNRPGWLASFSVSVDETRPGADAIRMARAGLRQREQAGLVRVILRFCRWNAAGRERMKRPRPVGWVTRLWFSGSRCDDTA